VRPSFCKLRCSDMSLDYVLDHVIPREFNPKLAEMVNKYAPLKQVSRQITRYWYIEEDSARVLIEHQYDDRTFNEYIVEILYSYRDLFVERKLDLNSLRHYIANVAILAARRSEDLSRDVAKLLEILGCTLQLPERLDVEGLSEEELLEAARTLSRLFGESASGAVRLTIKVRGKVFKKPVKNVPLRVIYRVFKESEVRDYETTAQTNLQGEAVVPVPRFSLVKLKVGGIEKSVNVDLQSREVVLEVLDFKTEVLPLAFTVALIASVITIVYLLVF